MILYMLLACLTLGCQQFYLSSTVYGVQGVQPLLNGVLSYLPCPTEVSNYALDQTKDEEKVLRFGNSSQTLFFCFILQIHLENYKFRNTAGYIRWNSRWTSCSISL